MRSSVVLALVMALAAVGPALAAKVTLSGEVTYRERMALPEDAVLRLQLVDLTLPNLPPRLDVEAPTGQGQVPLSFNLTFNDSLILPDHTYALVASIGTAGGTLFRNAEPHRVDPLEPAGPIVIVTGRVAENEPASAPAQSPPAVAPAIIEFTWQATRIGATPILPRAVPSLLVGGDLRAGGSGGCNSWYAQAMIDGDEIRFGSVTSTLRACTESVARQEQSFHAALAAVATWQVSGDTLTLYDSAGEPLLVFAR